MRGLKHTHTCTDNRTRTPEIMAKKQTKPCEHRCEKNFLCVYKDEVTTDDGCCCWSFFSGLTIGGDDSRFDDVDATFICRIHGMILLICTEPILSFISKETNSLQMNLTD